MGNNAIVGILRALLMADTAQFEQGMKRAGDAAKLWSRDLKTIGQQASQLGTALTKTLTLPIIAAGAALLKVGSDFDRASDAIRSATGATGQQLEALNASFKKVFETVPDSVDDVASAISNLSVRTGLTGKDLETLTTQMLNLARVTKSEIGPLTAATTRAFGDWSIATDKQSASLDFLFRTSQATGIGVTHLTELVVQFGAPLRALGFSFEEGAALMGKWEKEGVNLETVLSGLRFALGNFAKAGKEPAQALKEVQAAILGAKTESEATAIAFQAFGKRAAVDMSRAIIEGRFNIDELVKSLKNSKETINSAAHDTLSLSERFELLKNKVSVALEPLSRPLMAALENAVTAAKPLIEGLGKLAEGFAKLPGGVQLAVFGIAGLAASIGPLLFVFGQIVSSSALVIGAFGKQGIAARGLAAAYDLLAGSATTLGGVLAGLSGIAVLGILGGAAVLAVAKAHEQNLRDLAKAGEELGKSNALIAAKQLELDKAVANSNDLQAQKLRVELDALEAGRAAALQTLQKAEAEKAAAAATEEHSKATEKSNQEKAKQIPLGEAVAAAEKKIRDEIETQAKQTIPALVAALAKNKDGFEAWAKSIGLTSEQVSYLDGLLQKSKKSTEDQKKAAEALTKEVEKQRDALEKLGIVTRDDVIKQFKDLNVLWSRAVAEGVPLKNIAALLGPAFEELAEKAKKSGVEVKGLVETLQLMKQVLPSPKLDSLTIIGGDPRELLNVGAGLRNITAASLEAQAQQIRTNQAFEAFGLKTPKQLAQAAQAARDNFRALSESGIATAADLKKAREDVLIAERAAAKETISLWKTQIFPAVVDVVKHLTDAINGSFAQMLLGAKGFKDGFVDIWHSIQSAVLNVFNSILSAFVNQFLKGITAALTGARGGFGQAFSGLIGKGLGALTGAGGAAAAAVPGLATSGINAGGGFAGGFGAVGGGLSGAALAGLTAGIGGAIIAGFALYSRQNNVTAKSREKFATGLGFQNLGALYSQLQTMGPRGEQLANTGLNVIGRKDTAANERWMKDVEAFMETVKNFASTVQAATGSIAAGFTGKISAAFQSQTKTVLDSYDQQIEAARDNADEVKRLEDEKAAYIKRAQADIVANTQAEFDRISRITLGSYTAARAQGQSAVQAVQTIKPAIDELAKSAEAFGFAGNAAFDELKKWAGLVEANAPLLNQAQSLADLMKVLGDTGNLDAQMFKDLQDQGLSTYDSLIAAGFTEKQAREAIKPLLLEEIQLAKDKKFKIDEATAAIIAQMRANGELKDDEKKLVDVFIQGFSALLKFLKIDIPAAWQDTANAGAQAARDTERSWAGIRIKVPVDYEVGNMPSAPGGTLVPGAQHGGIFTKPTIIGIGEAGPEAAIPLTKLREMGFGGGMNMDRVVIENKIYLDGRQVAENQIQHLKFAAKRIGVRPI